MVPDPASAVLVVLLPAALGGALASFAGVAFDRLPRRESLGGRSRCRCGTQVRAVDNVPVLSWVRLRGQARCCGAEIPARYLFSEAAAVAGGASAGLAVLLTGSAPAAAALLVGGVVAAVAMLWWAHHRA